MHHRRAAKKSRVEVSRREGPVHCIRIHAPYNAFDERTRSRQCKAAHHAAATTIATMVP